MNDPWAGAIRYHVGGERYITIDAEDNDIPAAMRRAFQQMERRSWLWTHVEINNVVLRIDVSVSVNAAVQAYWKTYFNGTSSGTSV